MTTADVVRRAGRRVAGGWRRRRSAARRRRCSPTCCAGWRPTRSRVAVGVLTGALRQGRIGVGWATLRDVRPEPAADAVADGARGRRRRRPAGRDVGRRRRRAPAGRCSATCSAGRPSAEQELLWKMFGGELRQGALDGVMVDAVAKAAGVPVAAVRRAQMLAGDLGADRAAPRSRAASTRSAAVGHGAGPGGAADAGRAGRRRRGRAGGDRPGVGRVEARRRPDPGPPPRRRGAPLHPQPQRDHRPAAAPWPALVAGLPGGDLVLDGEALGVDDDGLAAPVPGHDGRLRCRCADRARARAVGVLLRRAARRRRRRSSTSRWSCARELLASVVPAGGPAAVDRHRRRRRGRRRSSTRPSAPATRA